MARGVLGGGRKGGNHRICTIKTPPQLRGVKYSVFLNLPLTSLFKQRRIGSRLIGGKRTAQIGCQPEG